MPAQNQLRYVEPEKVTIDGLPTEGLTVRAATGRGLGRLRGFIIDPMSPHLQYLVVRATGLLGKTMLLPVTSARIDVDGRAIEIDIDEQDLRVFRNFTPDKALAT